MRAIGGVIARTGSWRRVAIAGLAAVSANTGARADGPVDLPSAFERAFGETDKACVALRDVAPGAGSAVSDPQVCKRRLPPCATFELPSTVIALDRGVVADANAPVKRNPPLEGDPQNGVSLRDAFQKPVPWVYEEVSRRTGSEAFDKALAGMRYGNAVASGPVERIGAGAADGLTVSPPEQVEFLAKLKRGELPVSSESQARTVEIVPVEKIGEASVASKTGACDGAAWVVGWVDRPQRSSVIFATVMTGDGRSAEDAVAKTKKLLAELGLAPVK